MNTTTTAALEPITATGTRTSAQTITGAVGTIPDLDVPGVGWVALIGAGPGETGLMTLRGMDLLRRADVLVVDRLAPHGLLPAAPRAEVTGSRGRRSPCR